MAMPTLSGSQDARAAQGGGARPQRPKLGAQAPSLRPGGSLRPQKAAGRPTAGANAARPAREEAKKPAVKFTAEQVETKSKSALTELVGSDGTELFIEEASQGLAELGSDNAEAACTQCLRAAANEPKPENRTKIAKVLLHMGSQKHLSRAVLVSSAGKVISEMEEMKMDMPICDAAFAHTVVQLMVGEAPMYSIGDIVSSARACTDEYSAPGFNLLCHVLKAAKEASGAAKAEELAKKVAADVDLSYLAGNKETPRDILKRLADAGVGSAFPVWEAVAKVADALKSSGAPDGVMGLMRDLPTSSREFARAVVYLVFEAIGSNTKALDALDVWKHLLTRVVHDVEGKERQCDCLFSVQLFADRAVSPRDKEFMLVAFKKLLELDIVEEAAFDLWKDDTKDVTPGKRSAVLNTNTFFQDRAAAQEAE